MLILKTQHFIWSLLPKRWQKWLSKVKRSHFPQLSIAVPFASDTQLAKYLKRYYKSIGINAEFLLDSKYVSQVRPKTIHSFSGTFENTENRIESGYSNFSQQCRRNWIFRLDSDELPSIEAIKFARTFVSTGNKAIVAFPRYEVLVIDGEFYVANTPLFSPNNSTQYRLFNRNKVDWDTSIHTAGFSVQGPVVVAPVECAIYHLDRVVRDQASRESKSFNYSTQGQTDPTLHERYVVEIDPSDSQPIPSKEVRNFLHRTPEIVGLLNIRK